MGLYAFASPLDTLGRWLEGRYRGAGKMEVYQRLASVLLNCACDWGDPGSYRPINRNPAPPPRGHTILYTPLEEGE